MANKIRIKRSGVQGKTPTTADLDLGELGVNYFDGKLYLKKDNGTQSIIEVGASGFSDGDKGDITVSGSGSTWTVDAGAINTSKLGGDITPAGKALLDDATAEAQRATLGLGTLATQSGTFSGTSSGTNTGDQTITLTGDVTGTGTGTFAATLANSGATAGTYNSSATAVTPFAIDSKGRVTGTGAAVTITPSWASITSKPTTLSGYGITDAATSTHAHGNISNGGAIGTTANLPVITGTSGVLQAGAFGTAANTFCQGDDARLSDTRTPTDGTVTTAKLANDAVTYAKIQNVSAADRLLGRSTAGAGDVEEIICTAAGRALLDDADAAAQRTTLGLGSLATQSGTFSGTSSGTNTGDQTITLTGDVTGTGTGTFAATLANAGTAGTYTKVTTDAKGRVTSGASLAAADIPALTATKISDFDTQVRTSRLDQMAAPTASVSLNSQKITGLATPTADSDAATKAYVDAVKQGLDIKDSVRAATTANITLSGTQTIDGVAVVAGDRVLVKDQSTGSQNGIYVVAAGAWSRATDADSSAKITAGLFAFVTEGTAQADSGWVLTSNDPITLGTSALAFTQFSGAGQITAGDGLTKTGNTLNVGGTSGRIVANADSIDLASGVISATGTYSSVTVDTYGRVTAGTNPTTLAGYGITDAQPLDADLTSIAGLAGTSGFLKKTAANTWSLDTNTYLTGNQSISVTGDATGTGTTSIALTLANSGVTAGTYNSSATAVTPITVDAKGRVTGTGTAVTVTPAWSSITSKPTTLSGFGITDAASSAHTHGNITNAGAIGSTANLPIITTTSGVLTTGSFGTTANTFCQGNDSRLSDTRNTANSITFNNAGAGGSSGSTFNGGSALTVSYNTVGAPSTTGANASGSWGISVTGSSTSCTGNAATATTATNLNGGTVTATSGSFSGLLASAANATTFVDANDTTVSIRSNGTAAAVMSFHRPGAYAVNFGLDTDNVLKVGGWSMGAVKYPILHSNNYTSYAPSLTGSGASGTWGISITGNSATTSGCTFSSDSSDKDNITTRTDSGFYQSSTGTTAEGWPLNDNGWQHLIACTHSNDANYYSMQIAGGFYSQNWYFRNTNGSGTTAWSTMVHSGNVSSYALPVTGGAVSGDITMSGTGALRVANGTTAQRPTGANGHIRYNTTLGCLETFVQGAWQVIANTALDYGLITSAADTTFDYGALI